MSGGTPPLVKDVLCDAIASGVQVVTCAVYVLVRVEQQPCRRTSVTRQEEVDLEDSRRVWEPHHSTQEEKRGKNKNSNEEVEGDLESKQGTHSLDLSFVIVLQSS